MKLIIFVCVSNTCRSPMVEYVARQKLAGMGISDQFTVASRSLCTDYEPEGSPASAQGVEVMREDFGIDMTAHRSRLLTQEDVDNAFAIVPVKRSLDYDIQVMFSGAGGKLQHMSADIPDPWHQPVPVFRACASNISSMLGPFLEGIAKSEP